MLQLRGRASHGVPAPLADQRQPVPRRLVVAAGLQPGGEAHWTVLSGEQGIHLIDAFVSACMPVRLLTVLIGNKPTARLLLACGLQQLACSP